ncbi:uncharacterized protein LOC141641026 [Silene latifolia]|uniref:uncharacterized protein LOC141641026 n=1 Tax=Silene latifolia TaxID=37657 RepID=UPI003D775C23
MEKTEGGGSLAAKSGKGRSGVGNDLGGQGWAAPQEGFVKINVDVGLKEGEGSSFGVVCRNDRGCVEWDMAEALAVYKGLQEASRRGYQNVVVESDCLMVVDALKRNASGRSEFLLIVDDTLALSLSFSSVLWSFTTRVNNSVAHILAHCQPIVVGRIVWSDFLPEKANDPVTFDSRLI